MKLLKTLRVLFRRERLDADMAEEMQEHLERRMEANLAAGMSTDEARYAAQRGFGGVEQLKELAREQRGWVWLEQVSRDICFAMRQLAKSSGFTAVVVLTLALGIGATTAIFTAVNALILRPLPVPRPDELVVIVLPIRGPGTSQPISLRLYEAFRTRARSLSDLSLVSAYGSVRPFVANGPQSASPDFVQTEFVSGNFFSVLGSHASVGRVLGSSDDRRDQPQAVVVLSHGFWTRRFGADPSIVGKSVTIEKAVFTVIGVAAPGFFGMEVGRSIDVWCPLQSAPLLDPEEPPPAEDDWVGLPVARLRPGVSRAQAQAELDVIFQQDLARQAATRNLNNPVTRQFFVGRKLEVQPGAGGVHLGGSLRAQFQRPIALLMAVIGVVLLVTCCNVAGLLLARSAWRQRELTVRAALGASRLRLVGLLLGESMLLTLAGGLAGLFVAQWGTTLLAGYLPATGDALDLSPDGRVLAFSLVLSLGTGLACGLFPALQSSRVDLTSATKSQSGTVAGGANSRLNQVFVVTQIALSFLLLVAAGLFGRTLHQLRTIDDGFPRDNLTLVQINPGKSHPGRRGAELSRRILAELATSPGVRAATMTTGELLFSGGGTARLSVEGYTPAPDEIPGARFIDVGPRFFATLGLPLLRGRDVAEADFASGNASVAIINQTMARRFFSEADPVGRNFKWGRRTIEVIGVAPDTRAYEEVPSAPTPTFYLPFLPSPADQNEVRPMTFIVRTAGNSPAFAAGFRDVVRRLAPEARIVDLRTLDAALESSLTRERALAQLSKSFSALTLLLSGIGLYGLLSPTVARRTREIGVRMALGAQLREIAALIAKQGLGLVLLGCGLGLGSALAVTRFLEGFLYGVAPSDPFTFALAALVMLAVAAVACWLPVRRATKVDPVVALRTE